MHKNGAVEFSIEPCGIKELIWKPAVPFLVPAMGIPVWGIAVNGAVVGPASVGIAFTVMGFLRSLLWVFLYKHNGFHLDHEKVILVSRTKEERISLRGVSGIRFLEPVQGPEYRYGGFQKIELELRSGKKIEHKVAIFKGKCVEVSEELDAVAPRLGFRQDYRSFKDTGFWRK